MVSSTSPRTRLQWLSYACDASQYASFSSEIRIPTHMKSALKLTVTSKLDENHFVEQELDKVKRLLNVRGVFAGVRHGDLKSEVRVEEKGAGGLCDEMDRCGSLI